MSNTLGILETEPSQTTAGYDLSPSYIGAVNDARFVKGFGIAALIFSLLLFAGLGFLDVAVGIGTGLFIFRYGNQTFYRVLGTVVIVASLTPLSSLSPLILSCSVFWKGREVLAILASEGKSDDDWEVSRKRALIGTIASGAGISLVIVPLILLLVGLISVLVLS